MPLFAIASVIFLIKLATYTAIIQLTVFEMFKLYLFILPELLFYTLPVTFFVAAVMSLFKLSSDNEMVVFFALGIKPSFLLKTYFKPALLLTILLSFNFFVMFPHATVLSSNFIRYKTSEAKFNLSASEFGHNFGEWLLYIGKANPDKTYSDVFLFHKDDKEEVLLGGKKAEVINDGGILKLKLTHGEGYNYSKDKFSQMNYEELVINNMMTSNLREYHNAWDYWFDEDRRKEKIKMFITDALLSLFPIISLFMIVSIGVVHVRHQKGRIYLYIFLSLLLFYGMTIGLQPFLMFYTIPAVILAWLAVSLYFYKTTIVKRF
jgi:lipopolysaccharide export system permease protein